MMVITEHWLDERSSSVLTTLHDDFYVYIKCHNDHSSMRGAGGIAIFIRKSACDTVSSVDIPSSKHIIGARSSGL